jgi:hypothetical protein
MRLTPNQRKVVPAIPASKRYLETKKKKNLTEDTSLDSEEKVNMKENQNDPDQTYDYSYLPHLSPANSLEKEATINTVNQLKPITKQLKPSKPLKPTPTPKNTKNLQPKWITNYQRVNVKLKMVNLNKAKLYEILHPHIKNNSITHTAETPHGLSGKFQNKALIEMNTQTHEISIHNIHRNDLIELVKLAKESNLVEPTLNNEINSEELEPSAFHSQEKEEMLEKIKSALELEEDIEKAYEAGQMIAGFSG